LKGWQVGQRMSRDQHPFVCTAGALLETGRHPHREQGQTTKNLAAICVPFVRPVEAVEYVGGSRRIEEVREPGTCGSTRSGIAEFPREGPVPQARCSQERASGGGAGVNERGGRGGGGGGGGS